MMIKALKRRNKHFIGMIIRLVEFVCGGANDDKDFISFLFFRLFVPLSGPLQIKLLSRQNSNYVYW